MSSSLCVRHTTLKTIQSLLLSNKGRTISNNCSLLVPSSNITTTCKNVTTKALSPTSHLINDFQSMSFSTSSGKPRSNYESKKHRYNRNKQEERGDNNYKNDNKQMGNNTYSNPKLRPHAISVLDNDYTDYDDDNEDEYEIGEPIYDKFGNGFPNEDEDEKEWHRQRETEAYEKQLEEDAKRKKWIENAKPPVRVPKIDSSGRAYGHGGRKVSSARVWIYPGEGIITVNRRDFLDYFPRDSDREMILSPFVATKTCGMFDMTVRVDGGGVTGKAGAIRHGLARALEKYNPDYRPPMKRLGFMTRDNRQVERKKIGKKKARKAPQWVRR